MSASIDEVQAGFCSEVGCINEGAKIELPDEKLRRIFLSAFISTGDFYALLEGNSFDAVMLSLNAKSLDCQRILLLSPANKDR
jgi:hypothetical protein